MCDLGLGGNPNGAFWLKIPYGIPSINGPDFPPKNWITTPMVEIPLEPFHLQMDRNFLPKNGDQFFVLGRMYNAMYNGIYVCQNIVLQHTHNFVVVPRDSENSRSTANVHNRTKQKGAVLCFYIYFIFIYIPFVLVEDFLNPYHLSYYFSLA